MTSCTPRCWVGALTACRPVNTTSVSYTHLIRALLALHHVAGIGDAGQLDEPGVVGGVLGVSRPLPAIDVVRRRHRLAVGPFGIGSELEGVDGARGICLLYTSRCV